MLQIDNLKIFFSGQETLKGISFNIPKSSTYALVGESGSGKSITCAAILGLLPSKAKTEGKIIFNSIDLLSEPNKQKFFRGRKLAYIPQNPIASLNPVKTVYEHLNETLSVHKPQLQKKQAKKDYCREILLSLQFKNWERVLNSYPFELSGGMCQRILIGLALIPKPEIILADEPTTALDVTIQAEIMNLLLDKIKTQNLTLLLITHDLALVAQSCEYISVLKEGKICETGKVQEVFANPQHKYTNCLLNAF